MDRLDGFVEAKKRDERVFVSYFLVSWWHIWIYRNSVVFSSIVPKMSMLFDNIVSQSFAWCNVRAKRKFS